RRTICGLIVMRVSMQPGMKQTLLLCVFCGLIGTGLAQEYSESSIPYGIISSYGSPPGFSSAGGISCVDFNQDGLDDLTFARCIDSTLHFYENLGGGAFQLIDPPLVSNTDEVKGLLWFDYDNDGDKDLVTVAYGGPTRLYENTGGLNMVDVTVAAGFPLDSTPKMSVSAADYDRDGDLDLYICNYQFFITGLPPELQPPPDTNRMYRNNGDGTFTDVTAFTGTADSTRQSWCATFFDYNNDGWEDLYVANDRNVFRNALYHNNGDGTFSDVSAATGTDILIDAMNVGVADYDNNGFLDIYVTNTPFSGTGSAFLKNNGDSTFTDVAAATGTQLLDRTGWGGTLYDFDNDLDLDMYVSCSQDIVPNVTLPNGFYINDGTGTYTEPYYATGGLQGIDTKQSHCNTIGDFNNDGLWDIAVSQDGSDAFKVWENVVVNANHWFKLYLEGTLSNRDAIGTWIEVWISGQKYIRTTHSHQAFWAQYSNTMIIGTGTHAAIDSLILHWPYPSGGLPYTKQVIPGCQITMSAVNTFVEGQPLVSSSYTVTSAANDGPSTLRSLIENACGGDTITFDAALAGDTISLTGTPLDLDKDLVILGSGASDLVIRIAEQAASWTIPAGVTISISDLQILDGAPAPPDPLIDNQGTLILEDMTLVSQGGLGASQSFIASTGTLTQRGVVEIQRE
ncbi:MAG: CRTAC1 family protein, partial [Saprospiraceae bacterium]|nr:CRTAC1 family protein [Saprospiraceae bacterium]